MGMKIQDVTPEYVKEMRSLGISAKRLKNRGNEKIQDVTPEYVKRSPRRVTSSMPTSVGAKIMGVTPEFIQKAKSHGFTNLTIEKLIQLKNADIF